MRVAMGLPRQAARMGRNAPLHGAWLLLPLAEGPAAPAAVLLMGALLLPPGSEPGPGGGVGGVDVVNARR